MKLRVMLVDEGGGDTAALAAALCKAGCDVVARLCAGEDLLAAVRRVQPDAILVDTDRPGRDALERCAAVNREHPRPVVLLARAADNDTIAHAVRAGVSACVVDDAAVRRIESILEVAIARFGEQQTLRRELEDTRTRLADRRDVERAKALLMQRRKLEEAQAYALLRSNAMARRTTLGEAARGVLAAAELLDGKLPV